jgi:hypothetical protein
MPSIHIMAAWEGGDGTEYLHSSYYQRQSLKSQNLTLELNTMGKPGSDFPSVESWLKTQIKWS